MSDKERNRIGCLALDDMRGPLEPKFDNLAIMIATALEHHMDCPDEPDNEDGWKPWAIEHTNRMLDLIAQHVNKTRKVKLPPEYRHELPLLDALKAAGVEVEG